jgi:hypothetical protein
MKAENCLMFTQPSSSVHLKMIFLTWLNVLIRFKGDSISIHALKHFISLRYSDVSFGFLAMNVRLSHPIVCVLIKLFLVVRLLHF